jgi:hypothetical protein
VRVLRPFRERERDVREGLAFQRDAGDHALEIRRALYPIRARFELKRRIRWDAKPKNFRFKLDTSICAGCKLAEYACTCDE